MIYKIKNVVIGDVPDSNVCNEALTDIGGYVEKRDAVTSLFGNCLNCLDRSLETLFLRLR